MNVKQIRFSLICAALAGLLCGPAAAQTIDPAYKTSALLGIEVATGRLWSYDFASDSRTLVGEIRDVKSGQTLTGISASAYFTSAEPNYPGFQQLHAFWRDPADGAFKVIHIDSETAEAGLTGISLGEGAVNGAAASLGLTTVTQDDGSTVSTPSWRVFALQQNVEPTMPPALDGMTNINPSNSSNNEFTLETPDGVFTRDDLHKDAQVDDNGVFYSGPASHIFLRPKGNGNQNSLILNGDPFNFSNGSTYTFEGEMTVTVFNDHINNTKAMGHWWIKMGAQIATITENDVVILSPPAPWVPTSKIISIHTETGLATTLLELSQVYSGLATTDGNTFYAIGADGNLYAIDVNAMTETLVGPVAYPQINELAFAGQTLMGFDPDSDQLVAINKQTGETLGSPANLGVDDLGTFVFLPGSELPQKSLLAFD